MATAVVLQWQNTSINSTGQKIYRGTDQSNLTLIAEIGPTVGRYVDQFTGGVDPTSFIYQIGVYGSPSGQPQELKSIIIPDNSSTDFV